MFLQILNNYFLDIFYLILYLDGYYHKKKLTINENITINQKEIDKFSKLAEEWWDPNEKFKPLHKFNPVRLDYIKKSI